MFHPSHFNCGICLSQISTSLSNDIYGIEIFIFLYVSARVHELEVFISDMSGLL